MSFDRRYRFSRRLRRLAFMMISSTGFRFAPPGAKFLEPAPQAQGLSSYYLLWFMRLISQLFERRLYLLPYGFIFLHGEELLQRDDRFLIS